MSGSKTSTLFLAGGTVAGAARGWVRVFFPACLLLIACSTVLAQSGQQSSTDCTFEDGKQLMIRYKGVNADKPPEARKLWAPGGSPLTLFSQADLDAAGTVIPAAAYSLYVIPGEQQWTLVVNKNVSAPDKYDKAQDVVRLPMQTAKVGQPVEQLNVTFGRMSPTQCNLRIYYGSVAAFGVELKER